MMTTNQTIHGVSRETLAFALGFTCHGHKNRTDQAADMQAAKDKLRALLDGPVAAYSHDGGNNQKGDGPAITGATTQGFHSSGDGGGCTFTFMPAAQAEGVPEAVEQYQNKVKHLRQLLRNVRATLHFSPEDVLAIDAALREDEE